MAGGFIFQPVVSEAPQFHKTFSRFAESVDDWRPVFERIVDDYREGAREQFTTAGIFGSAGWEDLSPTYAAWKEEHKPGMPILVFSGLLMNAATNPEVKLNKKSLTLTIDDSGSYQIFSKRLGRLVTKTKPAVAGFHQTGAGRLPVRRVIELPQSQRTRWVKIFHDWLVTRWQGRSS
jgi:hypothetical protein